MFGLLNFWQVRQQSWSTPQELVQTDQEYTPSRAPTPPVDLQTQGLLETRHLCPEFKDHPRAWTLRRGKEDGPSICDLPTLPGHSQSLLPWSAEHTFAESSFQTDQPGGKSRHWLMIPRLT